MLADFAPGGTSHIKLRADGVDEWDILSYNVVEVIARYELDPDNDEAQREVRLIQIQKRKQDQFKYRE